MEHKDEAQEVCTSEYTFDATAYCIKSILPDNKVLRDIILHVAVNSAINQASHT